MKLFLRILSYISLFAVFVLNRLLSSTDFRESLISKRAKCELQDRCSSNDNSMQAADRVVESSNEIFPLSCQDVREI